MITRGSALCQAAIANAELSRQRSRVLVDLCRSRMSFAELAIALNCREDVVRSLLVSPFRSIYLGGRKRGVVEELDLDRMPQLPLHSAPYARASLEHVVIEDREKLARKLAVEVHGWLRNFQASNAEQQQVIEGAGLQLDKRTSTWDGKYKFPGNWLVLDILGVSKPLSRPQELLDFRSDVGPRLANWIHFWIADPIIWDRALDLEFAFCGAKAHTAMPITPQPVGVSDVQAIGQGAA